MKAAHEEMTNELIQYLTKEKLWVDAGIYVNQKRIRSTGEIEEGVNVTDYIEYGNPDTLTVYYEGPLYMHMNGHVPRSTVEEELNKIVGKYGYFIQPGHAWNFTLYDM